MPWNVIGQEWAAQILQQHIARGQVRHAYLLAGPQGVGRRTLALRFAQAINCLNPPEPGQPCGECRACQQIERMQHPDLSVLQAAEDSTVIKVDQVRDLQRSLSLSPYEAKYRVALLRNFHDANPSAQNALLKTLEEAPERVILLLTADAAEALLPTISSRCEILRLRPLALDELQAALVERWQIDANDARLLAHLSGGRVGLALRMREDPDLSEQRVQWINDLIEMLGQTRRERFAYADSIARGKDRAKVRENLRQQFQAWASFWRDLMLAASGCDAALINLDFEEEIRQLARFIDLPAARARTADAEKALQRLDANVNMQLLAEVLLLDLPRVQMGM